MFSPIVSLKTPAGRAVFFKDMVSGTVIVPGFYKGHMSNSGKMRRICVEPVNPDIREYLRIYLKHIKYGEKFHFWEDHDF